MSYTAAGSAAEEIESRLMERGLIHAGAIGLPQMIAGMIMASPLLIGGPKLLVGMERGRPVAFLFVACAVTMALAIVMLVVRSRRTTQGKALLNEYTAKYEARRGDLTTDPAALGAAEMSMLVGLWGVSLLSVGPLAPLYRAMPRESGGGGCGGSGCGGGGGGGCGGGGCGGGGCGGCGGG
jgi:uncharacterized protein (TIGR04222 family)